jgi:hypothetical protein
LAVATCNKRQVLREVTRIPQREASAWVRGTNSITLIPSNCPSRMLKKSVLREIPALSG